MRHMCILSAYCAHCISIILHQYATTSIMMTYNNRTSRSLFRALSRSCTCLLDYYLQRPACSIWHIVSTSNIAAGALSVEAARYASTSKFVGSAESAGSVEVAHASTSDSAASSRVAHPCRVTLQSRDSPRVRVSLGLGIGVEMVLIHVLV